MSNKDRDQLSTAKPISEMVPYFVNKFSPAHALPIEIIVPTAEAFTQGTLVDWKSPRALADFNNLMSQANNPINRLMVNVAIAQRGEPETDAALSILTDDLKLYKPSKELLDSSQAAPWWAKFVVGTVVASALEYSRGIFRGKSSGKKIAEEAERQRKSLIKTLSSLAIADLPTYIRFSEFFLTTDSAFESAMSKGNKTIEKKLAKDPMFSPFLEPSGLTPKSTTPGFPKDLVNEYSNTWVRLSAKWGWKQVEVAISAIKTASLLVRENLRAALETNFLQSQGLKNFPSFQEVESLDPEGIVELTKYDWDYDDDFLSTHYPLLESKLAGNLELDDKSFSVPLKILPTATIALFERLLQTASEGQVATLMEEVNNIAKLSHKASQSWLLALLVLRHTHPQVNNHFPQLISGLDIIPDPIKSAILDQTPGIVILTPEGKLRLSQSYSASTNGFRLYASKKPAVPTEPEPAPAPTISLEPKVPENQLTADIYTYDFVGEIGVMENDQVLEYLNKQRARRIFPEEEIDEKIITLQEKFEMPKDEKTLIFHYPLNVQDEAAKEAKRLGIETVVISGNVVTFVLDKDAKDQPYSTNAINKKIPVAFTATLDTKGWLTLDAQDEQMNQNPSQDYLLLTLNMIVLDLASKKPQEQEIAEKRQVAKPTIDQWNRNSRGSLPRLTLNLSTDSDVLIAVKTNGQTVFTTQS